MDKHSAVRPAEGHSEAIATEQIDGWTLVFTRGIGADGTYLYHSVQLVLNGEPRNRITVSKPHQDSTEVVEQLRRRARRYFVDFEERTSSGGPDSQS